MWYGFEGGTPCKKMTWGPFPSLYQTHMPGILYSSDITPLRIEVTVYYTGVTSLLSKHKIYSSDITYYTGVTSLLARYKLSYIIILLYIILYIAELPLLGSV